MGLVKKCRHGRGKSPRARRSAWRYCGCRWYADIRVQGVRRWEPLSPVEDEARDEFARLAADNAAGKLKLAIRTRPGVESVVRAWLESVKAEKPPPRPASVNAYRSRVKVIAEWYGDTVPIGAIETREVEEFLDDVETTYSANYARDIRTTLGHVFAWAVRQGLRKTSPMPNDRRRRRKGAPVERLSIEEAERVIGALSEPLRSMAEVALLTGLRRGELLGLRARDVDLDRARLRLAEQVTEHGRGPLKTETSNRVVPLSPRAVELLRERADSADGGKPVFPIHYQAAGLAMREAMKRVNVYQKGRGWHSFRHANAALRDLAGESLRSAAASLGHGARHAQTLAYGWSAESEASPLDEARRQS